MNNNFESTLGLDSQNVRNDDVYGNMTYYDEREDSLTRKLGYQLFVAIFSSVITAFCMYLTIVFFADCYMQSLSFITFVFWLFGIFSLLTMACTSYFWDKLFAVIRQFRDGKMLHNR